MACGICGGEGHNRRTCTNKRGALAQEDALTTATYDGRELRLNGRVVRPLDDKRKLVAHILFMPGVTAIHEDSSWRPPVGTFYGCTSLTSVNLPEGLTTIGGGAFSYCTSLTSINLPERLTTIGSHAFYGCTSLSSISFPEGLTAIGGYAFWGCTTLSSVSFPEEGRTTIEESSFAGCTLQEQCSVGHRAVEA